MKTKVIAILSLVLLSSYGFGQKKFTNPEKAKSLKLKYKNEGVVATNSESVYKYILNDKGIKIKQQDQVDLISLKSNIKYKRFVHYNDNIEHNYGSIAYTSGRGLIKSNKICGDYEVDDIFYSDAKMCVYIFDILYESSEVTFKSEKTYLDPKYLTRVFFHDVDATESREISFVVDNDIEIELVEMNFEGFDIQKEVTEEDGKKTYTYKSGNLNELKQENKSLGYLHHYPHIVILTKNYKLNNKVVPVLSSTDDLYNWYSQLVKQEYQATDNYAEVVKELISGAKTDDEKIKNIYYWVQENIKYIAFEDGIAGFKPETPHNVFNNRYGDCKGMANLTKAMLKEAGFDARLTWIGTNKIPYTYDLPSLAVDNHMICTVFLNEKFYILDATEKYIALGNHAERIQGKEMLIEDGDAYIRKNVPTGNAKQNLIERTENFSVANNNLEGEGSIVVNGEAKKNILYFSTNSKVEEKEELYDFLSVSEFSTQDEVNVSNIPVSDRERPLIINYNYNLGNKVSSFDKDIYIEYDWEKDYGNLTIENERFTDYYFGRKVMNKVTKKIRIPSGFKVSHLPESFEDGYKDVSIKVKFKQEGKYIIYSNFITIGSGKIKKEDFTTWNNLIKKLNDVYSDQIVLTKI